MNCCREGGASGWMPLMRNYLDIIPGTTFKDPRPCNSKRAVVYNHNAGTTKSSLFHPGFSGCSLRETVNCPHFSAGASGIARRGPFLGLGRPLALRLRGFVWVFCLAVKSRPMD